MVPRRTHLVVWLVQLVVVAFCWGGVGWAELALQITTPAMDPATLSLGETCDFTAVAALDGKPLDPADLTWEWDFGDKSELSKENPAPHAYTAPGEYLVTVAAFYEKQSTSAKVTVIVEEGGSALDGGVGAELLFVPSETICDLVYVKFRIPRPLGYQGQTIYFDKWINGAWVQQGSGVSGSYYTEGGVEYWGANREWATPADHNVSISWRARYSLVGMGPPPKPPISGDVTAAATPDNTVIKSSAPLIIIHNPPQTHNVPWSITHAAREGPTFTVTVEVCDMSGGVVVTHSETQVGPGSGSWTWDGKINGVDAAKGLYISRVYTSHYFQGAGGCSDRDKTDVLSEVSLDAFAWVEPDFPDRAAVMLQYTLAQACSDVTVTAYAPNLETTTIYVPTDGTLPGSAGTHNVFVEFKVRRDQMGPYSFVITGMQADGSANRDGLPKALVPQGAVQAVAAPATTVASDGFGSWFFDLAKAATLAEQTEHNLPYAIGSAEATTWAITDTLKHAAVLAYYGHSDATSIGDGSGNNKYLFSSDLDGLSVGHVLFALWGGCDTANPTQYTGENWLVASQRNGIDCAVGWTTSVSLGALAKFAEFLWHDLSADSAWVSLACNDAAWTTHLWFLCVPTGILNYNMYGDVQLMPARFGER